MYNFPWHAGCQRGAFYWQRCLLPRHACCQSGAFYWHVARVGPFTSTGVFCLSIVLFWEDDKFKYCSGCLACTYTLPLTILQNQLNPLVLTYILWRLTVNDRECKSHSKKIKKIYYFWVAGLTISNVYGHVSSHEGRRKKRGLHISSLNQSKPFYCHSEHKSTIKVI